MNNGRKLLDYKIYFVHIKMILFLQFTLFASSYGKN